MKRTDSELVQFLKDTADVPRRGVMLTRLSDNLGVMKLFQSAPPHSIPYEIQFTIYKGVDTESRIFLELMILEGELICTHAVADVVEVAQLIDELRSL